MDTKHAIAFYLDENVASHLVNERYEEISSQLNDPFFCSALKGLYMHPESFEPMSFKDSKLSSLIRYLEMTHSFYLDRRLPEIEQTVSRLMDSGELSISQAKLIELFFQSYTHQLSIHIQAEDQGIIAYAKKLDNGIQDPLFRLEDYLEHHDNVDEILIRLCDLLRMESNLNPFSLSGLLITQIELLQQDLYIHSLIEEQVFLDFLLKKERDLKK